MAGVAQRTVYAMRRQVEEKFERLPLKFYDSRTHGEILSRAVNDMDNISSTLQQNLTQLITSVVTLIGVIVMMLTISPLLTLVVVLTLPLSMLITATIAKRSQTFFRAAADGARRAQRPRRGDVHRPQDRQGVRPRGRFGRASSTSSTTTTTTPAGGRSSSPASSCR